MTDPRDLLGEVRLLTVTEVAELMRVSKMTVYRLVHNGEIAAVRVGRSFRVPESAVRNYLSEQFLLGAVAGANAATEVGGSQDAPRGDPHVAPVTHRISVPYRNGGPESHEPPPYDASSAKETVLPVSIWLGDGIQHVDVEQAVSALLNEVDYVMTDREPPQFGSWFRSSKARARDFVAHLSPEQLAAEIERKLRIEIFDKAQAAIDNQQATGAAALIAALQGEDRACIRVGSLLVIKVDGLISVNNLTQHQLAWLERNQAFLRDPKRLLEELDALAPSDLPLVPELPSMQSQTDRPALEASE